MADSSFNHRARTAASPETVWEELQDPATWATVAGVDSTTDHVHRDGRLAGFRFTISIAGVGYRGRAEVAAARPYESMELAVRSNEVNGSIFVDLVPLETGTEMSVAMKISPAGLLGSMVFPVISSAVGNSFVDSVDRLADRIRPG